MSYINDCIDCNSEFGKKYLALVSENDSNMATHTHHIVPVAYYKDILGITDCRKSISPDMHPSNLVKLSVGKHLLAHYYLMKCAKKCIKAQMTNAFACTYKTTSVDEITESDVITRMVEIDAAYAKLKNGKRPHKDGVVISKGTKTHRLTNWMDGEKYGTYLLYDNKFRIQELGNYNSSIQVRFGYFDEMDDEYVRNRATNYNSHEYTSNELTCISIVIANDVRGSFCISPNEFSLDEWKPGQNPNLIQMDGELDWENQSYKYSYSFRTPYGDTVLDRISLNDMDSIKSWLRKSSFTDTMYEVIASVLDFITQCKEVCPHLYANMRNNCILNELSNRAASKSLDIANMFNEVNNYIANKNIPNTISPTLSNVSTELNNTPVSEMIVSIPERKKSPDCLLKF